jgi:tetratricopeptide (TPR) repeat protein
VFDNEKFDLKAEFTERLINFLHSIRVLLWIILGGLIAGLLFYFIFMEINSTRKENATFLAEKAAKSYSDWLAEEDDSKKKSEEEKLSKDIEAILKAYPGQYASQRALHIRGNLHREKEEWEKAYESYFELYERFPSSYLGEEGLFLSAVCKEEANDSEEAIELLTQFADQYKKSPRLPHAYFSLGRLHELQEDYEEAHRIYNLLRLDYQTSNWTNFAINRIIYLKSKGKISE